MRGLLTVVLVAAAATLVAGSLTADAAHKAQHKIVTVHAGGTLGLRFGPSTAKAKLGDTVHWMFDSGPHTSTDASALMLWDSGSKAAGTTFDRVFAQAGTYDYKCSLHASIGMTGIVKVPIQAAPKTGSPGDTFTVTWSSAAIPAGFAMDVQEKTPADTRYVTVLKQTTTLSKGFVLTNGAYRFRARLVKLSPSATTGWSPAATVTVG
jgi:plastocyanin